MSSRIQQLDFLKCVCIVLMVMFHLVFIGDKFPYAKSVVYTFHMPVFLLLSGFLVHTQRPARQFFRSQWWIFVPYLIMELPYVVLSGFLGVRGADAELSVPLLLYRVFADPLGPYWYLHTLLICNITLWGVQWLFQRQGWLLRLFVYAVVLVLLVYGTGLVAQNVLYYFLGVVIAQAGVGFFSIFHPSFLSLLLGVLLCCFPGNLHYATPGGMLITYFAINFMLWVYNHCTTKILVPILYIGRNTLVVLLFSPIFTMLVKPLVPVLSFDPTGLIFLTVATSFSVLGSFAVAWVMDRLRLSRWFCGRREILLHL